MQPGKERRLQAVMLTGAPGAVAVDHADAGAVDERDGLEARTADAEPAQLAVRDVDQLHRRARLVECAAVAVRVQGVVLHELDLKVRQDDVGEGLVVGVLVAVAVGAVVLREDGAAVHHELGQADAGALDDRAVTPQEPVAGVVVGAWLQRDQPAARRERVEQLRVVAARQGAQQQQRRAGRPHHHGWRGWKDWLGGGTGRCSGC